MVFGNLLGLDLTFGRSAEIEKDIALDNEVVLSFRQLNPDTVNCVTLRRDSDDAEQTFGFVYGYLDTASITSWLSGATAYIKTWYNQGNLGGNFTNANTGTQPKLTISDSQAWYTNEIGGASGRYLKSATINSNDFLTDTAFDISAVVEETPAAAPSYFLGVFRNDATTEDSRVIHVGIDNSDSYTLRFYFDDATFDTASTASTIEAVRVSYESPGSSLYVNGSLADTSSFPEGDLNGSEDLPLHIGYGNLNAWKGKIFEIVAGSTNDNGAVAHANQIQYYGI